jgi:hypothetical protein
MMDIQGKALGAISATVGGVAGGAKNTILATEGLADWTSAIETTAIGAVACFVIWLIIRYLVPSLAKIMMSQMDKMMENQEEHAKEMLSSVQEHATLLVENATKHLAKVVEESEKRHGNYLKEHTRIMQEIKIKLDDLGKAQAEMNRMQEAEAQLIAILATKLASGKDIELSELKEVLEMLNKTINP